MADEWKTWIKRAKSNLKLAKTPKTRGLCYEDLCFEAQQCAEKALKALLLHYNLGIPKVHSFHILLEKLEVYLLIPEDIKDVLDLSDYAVQTRYPGDYTPLKKKEYEHVVEIAERVLKWVNKIIKNKNNL